MDWIGTGEARLCSLVSKDRMYKPVVKSFGAQRESDGVVVPQIAMQQNVAGGKGPGFGRVGDGGKREGMTGTARSNHPRRRERAVKVRQLQNQLLGSRVNNCCGWCGCVVCVCGRC